MLAPSEFARLAVIHGSVATVSDPHEIANVLGLDGINFMLDNASKTNFKFFFGASACVPATTFETSGATLTPEDIEKLLQNPKIKFLSEVMNFPGVLMGDKDMLAKIELAKKYNKPIDGHAPALSGDDLKKYIDSGISTDEAFSYEEGLEKLQNSMKILIREGSAAKNFDALHKLIDKYHKNMMFCSDDRHPNDLVDGHINNLVKRAIKLGHNIFDVLEMACINPIKHYNLEVGSLNIADSADFIIVDNLEDFNILQTYIDGKLVAKDGKTLLESVDIKPINFFKATKKSAKDFYMPKCENMEVIEVIDHELFTNELVLNQDKDDILKIAVINRYEDVSIKAIAHTKGFGIKDGAIASSVAHDSHNIIVVGSDDELMAKAYNLIVKSKGGISAVSFSSEHCLELDIAGIMSSFNGFEVAKQYEFLDNFVKNDLKSTLDAPFMTLSFMALLVIPTIKLSDKGLFDSRSFHFIAPCKKNI
jgi:adenine deaminase